MGILDTLAQFDLFGFLSQILADLILLTLETTFFVPSKNIKELIFIVHKTKDNLVFLNS